jgi:hypothetical protein
MMGRSDQIAGAQTDKPKNIQKYSIRINCTATVETQHITDLEPV